MLPKLNLCSDECDLLPDVAAYRRLIGRLLYLTLSRPDIMFTVHKLSQFVACSHLPHLKAAHHLLRYLKSHPGQEIFFSSTHSLQVKAFSDSDWGSCLDTRKSVTGYCVFLGDSLISWRSDRPKTWCVKCTPMCASARVAPSNIMYQWYRYRSTGIGVLTTEICFSNIIWIYVMCERVLVFECKLNY